MKLVNVVKKDLTIYFLLTLEIKVDCTFAQFSLPGNAFDGHGFKALFEKQFPCRFEDGAFPVFFLATSSFLKCQDSDAFRFETKKCF